MKQSELLQAIAVTAELCGRTLSPAAAEIFCKDLENFPAAQIVAALARCRKEVRGALTIQDVVSRIDDGRPGPEEAWAMLPMTESQTVVWTAEMSQAFGVVVSMIDAGEVIPARMAFKETYIRLVNQARDHGLRVEWSPTLGHDAAGREPALQKAVAAGRLSLETARAYFPLLPGPESAVLAIDHGKRGALR